MREYRNILKTLSSKNQITISNSKQKKNFASYNLVKTMRAGILVLGPLLAKFGSAKVSLPGGCAIGTRPVDIHLKALSKLGVKYKIDQGYVIAKAPKGLKGSNIRFPKISVGATENLIIAASLAKGTTILSNCAIEPEIKDLVNFLNKMRCKIKWISKRTIKIVGVNKLKEINYSKFKKIINELIKNGIDVRPVWYPCHMQDYLKKYETYKISLANKIYKNTLCLPSSYFLNKNDLSKICKKISDVLKKK